MRDVSHALFATLDGCARHGKRCPTVGDLATLLSVSTGPVLNAFDTLRNEKKIAWTLHYCGTGIGKVRLVTILATGHTTARPEFARRPKGSFAAVNHARDQLEHAKTALRRLGRIVYDAEVTDGPAGRGFIRVDNENLKPADVLAMARATGTL